MANEEKHECRWGVDCTLWHKIEELRNKLAERKGHRNGQ